MHRRSLLESLASWVGLTAVAGAPLSAHARPTAVPRTPAARSFVRADDGTALFYQDWGSGRPLVFVAPWGLNSQWWEYQLAALASPDVRCIALDRRGHGRSDQPGRGYDFDTLATDLARLIDQLDLRNATLVGHSMGCAEVVRYLSRDRGGRVTRAVLVATITPLIVRTSDNPDGVERVALERGRAAFRKDRALQIGNGAAGFFGAPKNPVSQATMDWWTRMMVDQCSLKTMLDLHVQFTETDFAPDLRRVTVPTLLIHGDSDTSARLDLTGRKSARLVPGSELRVYEGAAHGLPVTHAERLNADLLAFTQP